MWGPRVVTKLRSSHPKAKLIGFDSGFFGHCLTDSKILPEQRLDAQHFGDVRKFPATLLEDADAVVHLAAVSNDPMGNQFEAVTEAINQKSSIAIARLARAAGVKNFVFASSCSMYGFAEGEARKEDDATNPLTAYARSKIGTEKALEAECDGQMVTTCLRFATACGMSDRLRLDLVLNDFAACAITAGEISVLSDGTPWRPLIDVDDMASCIDWGVTRKVENGGAFVAVNAGSNAWNYQVRELADAVARAVPGTTVSINENAQPDKRSYRVDFSLFESLAPDHQPAVTLKESIARLIDGLRNMGFNDPNFRDSDLMRLRALQNHIQTGSLDADLNWSAA